MLQFITATRDYDKVNVGDPLDEFVGWPLALLLTAVAFTMLLVAYCSFRLCRRPVAVTPRVRGRDPVFVITMVQQAREDSVPPSYEQATQFPPLYDPPPYYAELLDQP